jgi:20S proteasome alpha/beta subunit|tara:strand:+ start:511 stop:690 length:180 start_codon:yes stop_codon:yes gene_type:complete
MKVEDNKIVIKKTIELMQKYNISKEYQKESTVKELIRIMDKAVDKVMKNKTRSKNETNE